MIPEINTPLKINNNPEKLKETMQFINQTIAYLQFLNQELETTHATQQEVDTQMSLAMNALYYISDNLELDEIKSKTREWTANTVANMSTELKLLQEEIGSQINAEQLTAALVRYKSKFENWYEHQGFHYASLTCYTHCIEADFSAEVYDFDPDEEETETKFGPSSNFALIKSPFKCELFDCDKNRIELATMFKNAFPNARIRKFESRRSDDPTKLGLRITVLIDYKDIENLSFKN